MIVGRNVDKKIISRLFIFFTIVTFVNVCCPQLIYTDPQGPVFLGSHALAYTAKPDTIKVVTFNIEYGEKIDLAITELQTIPQLKNAHIILLQEMDEKGVEKIARALKLNYVYYPSAIHTYGRNFGEAVLSCGEITGHFKIILPYRNPICDQKRIAAMAFIKFGNTTILAGSMHLEVGVLSAEKRIEQANAVLNAVPDSIDYAVLGGDYNTLSSATIDSVETMIEKAGFRSATSAVDYTIVSGPFGWLKFNMDHLYVRGLIPIGSGSCKKSQASDHFPVWAKLLFAGRRFP